MMRPFLYAPLHISMSEDMTNKEITNLCSFFQYHFKIMLHLIF